METSEQKVTSDVFSNLYQRISCDEDVVKINDAPGITIVRKYEEKSDYFKDGNRMFIKIYIDSEYIVGMVHMVKRNEEGTFRMIIDVNQYKRHFTNFSFGKEENITFNFKENKFLIIRKNKKHELNFNDFVNLLVKNHLSDRLFFKKKINKLKIHFLEFIFWLMDSKYNWMSYYDLVNNRVQTTNKSNKDLDLDLKKLKIEPFFKYFEIYRKTLFLFMVLVLCLVSYFFKSVNSYHCMLSHSFCSLFKVEYFNITNPIFLFSFFVFLFLLHYFSLFLQRKVSDKEGFVYKLHNSSLNLSFSLKIYE